MATGALMLGVLLGGGGVEAYHRTALAHSKELFNQKIRCNSLGRKYAQSESSVFGIVSNQYSMALVDFSQSRSSCVAELMNHLAVQGKPDVSLIQIVDLNSTEILKIEPCQPSGDCTDAMKRARPEFDQFLGVRTAQQ